MKSKTNLVRTFNSPEKAETGSTEGSTATAPASEKPAKKTAKAKSEGASRKAKPAKKTAKGKKAAKTKKESTPRGPSTRLRTFHLLAKHTNGLTNAAIREKLEVDAVASMLKSECLRKSSPRIRREEQEGVRGHVFLLTAAGKKAISDGTVDSEAAPAVPNVDWPANR